MQGRGSDKKEKTVAVYRSFYKELFWYSVGNQKLRSLRTFASFALVLFFE